MDILEDVRHRPWPVPDEPWILRQSWNDLLFTHWPIDHAQLRKHVPAFLDIDTFDGQSWLSITPFRLTDLSPRGLPALPWISSFDEITVRTYVLSRGIPGIYFFSLDANSTTAVAGASTAFHLSNFFAEITVQRDRGWLSVTSHRSRGESTVRRPVRAGHRADRTAPGTLTYWLTERYFCIRRIPR